MSQPRKIMWNIFAQTWHVYPTGEHYEPSPALAKILDQRLTLEYNPAAPVTYQLELTPDETDIVTDTSFTWLMDDMTRVGADDEIVSLIVLEDGDEEVPEVEEDEFYEDEFDDDDEYFDDEDDFDDDDEDDFGDGDEDNDD